MQFLGPYRFHLLRPFCPSLSRRQRRGEAREQRHQLRLSAGSGLGSNGLQPRACGFARDAEGGGGLVQRNAVEAGTPNGPPQPSTRSHRARGLERGRSAFQVGHGQNSEHRTEDVGPRSLHGQRIDDQRSARRSLRPSASSLLTKTRGGGLVPSRAGARSDATRSCKRLSLSRSAAASRCFEMNRSVPKGGRLFRSCRPRRRANRARRPRRRRLRARRVQPAREPARTCRRRDKSRKMRRGLRDPLRLRRCEMTLIQPPHEGDGPLSSFDCHADRGEARQAPFHYSSLYCGRRLRSSSVARSCSMMTLRPAAKSGAPRLAR